jgi:hypothetical protein
MLSGEILQQPTQRGNQPAQWGNITATHSAVKSVYSVGKYSSNSLSEEINLLSGEILQQPTQQ